MEYKCGSKTIIIVMRIMNDLKIAQVYKGLQVLAWIKVMKLFWNIMMDGFMCFRSVVIHTR